MLLAPHSTLPTAHLLHYSRLRRRSACLWRRRRQGRSGSCCLWRRFFLASASALLPCIPPLLLQPVPDSKSSRLRAFSRLVIPKFITAPLAAFPSTLLSSSRGHLILLVRPRGLLLLIDALKGAERLALPLPSPHFPYRVSRMFRAGAAMGLTVCRTWAFNDGGYNTLQLAPGRFDERVFKALDRVVAEAARHGVRLLLSLDSNLEAYGGKTRYMRWALDEGVGLTASNV